MPHIQSAKIRAIRGFNLVFIRVNSWFIVLWLRPMAALCFFLVFMVNFLFLFLHEPLAW